MTRQGPRSTRSLRRALVLTVVLAAAVAAVLVLTAGKSASDYEITAEFTNASQLVKGNVVMIGGTDVGRVNEIRLGDHGNALVTFSVDDAYAPLRRGTIAQVRSSSLSGVANRQVQLTLPPRGKAGAEIPDGGTMTRAETVSEVDLDELFNTLDPKTVADFKNVIKGFATSYRGVGAGGQPGLQVPEPVPVDLAAHLRRADPGHAGARAADRQRLAALAHRRLAPRRPLAARRQPRRDDERDRPAADVAADGARGAAPTSCANFNTTAVNLRSTLDDLDPLVDASKPVADRLGPFFRNFRAASADLVPTVRDLDRIVATPGKDNDLVDLTRLQPRLAKIAVGPVNRHGAQRRGALPESSDSAARLARRARLLPRLLRRS